MEIEFIILGVVILLSVIVGWFSNDIYYYIIKHKQIEGLRLNSISKDVAFETARSYEPLGDWICVNVDNMYYDRAVEVCQHEAGHEIFAEILEKNPEKIKKVMEALENE